MLQQLQDTEEKKYMNRIETAFKNKKAFIPFITAGYPNIKKRKILFIKWFQPVPI